MLKVLLARLRQGHRTAEFPAEEVPLPERFRGKPALDPARCLEGCQACAEACPTDALEATPGRMALDLGRCLFCAECARACPQGAVAFSKEHRLATRRRVDLLVRAPPTSAAAAERSLALSGQLRKLLGRSLKLRQVSAGGCNACEADVNVLGTVVFDLGRFGIQFVASPRHADGLLITGAISENMRVALKKTYDAVPSPKIVIAVGACAISGGPYAGHPEVHDGADAVVPVDLYVPGCPPHPYTILEGLLGLLGRIPTQPGIADATSEVREEIRHEIMEWGGERAEAGVASLGIDLKKGPATPRPGR